MPRLRRRLDSLENDAHQTMALARALLDELIDGVSFTVEIAGKELPVKIKLNVLEDEDKK